MRYKFIEFLREDTGVAAVEFSLVSIPFIIVIFLILNFSLIFMEKQLLAYSIDEEARYLKVNTRKANTMHSADISKRICGRLFIVFQPTCPDIDIEIKGFKSIDDTAIYSITDINRSSTPGVQKSNITRFIVKYQWNNMIGLFDNAFNSIRKFKDHQEVRIWVNE